jgi:hypothetical protein
MTYESFVRELLHAFPALSNECYGYMDEREPLSYVAMGCVLIPWLQKCLEARDTEGIARVCDFLETVASEGIRDSRFTDLIAIEIGEWLSEARERKLLLSHLGPNTRRACSYYIDRLQDQSS